MDCKWSKWTISPCSATCGKGSREKVRTKIVEENRDILIGIIGMLTGSISSMLAIASGRDPSEVEELKDEVKVCFAKEATKAGGLEKELGLLLEVVVGHENVGKL